MLEQLDMPVASLATNLSAADLATLQAQLDGAKDLLKKRHDTFDAVMLRKFEASARAVYTAEKKDTGTIHLPATNTMNLKVEIDKTVKWDQTKLYTVFSTMKPEEARHYAKTEYKVEEAKYKAAPPADREKLKGARTVVAGKLKFTFEYTVPAEDQIEQEAA